MSEVHPILSRAACPVAAVALAVLAMGYGPTTASATVYGVSAIRGAYGFDKIAVDGSGQTIAIIEDYDATYIQSDVNLFDKRYSLPALTTGVNLSIVGDDGGAVPTKTTTGPETALDVEWAHAIAPGANILLVETNGNIAKAVKYAATVPGVSVVSVSYGSGEFAGEKSYDSYYAQPADHAGVAFVASSGDSSKTSYAAASPNVIAVGGTTLTVGARNTYGGEAAWANSGGGVSPYESEPAYQKLAGSFTGRVTPDVSYNGSDDSPFQTYIQGVLSYSWGTSAGAPQWAALLALADQQRALNGLGTLSSNDALTMMYTLYASGYYSMGFNDITSGVNGSGITADVGYDAVTGLGTPKADWLVQYLGGSIAIPEPTAALSLFTIGLLAGRRRLRFSTTDHS